MPKKTKRSIRTPKTEAERVTRQEEAARRAYSQSFHDRFPFLAKGEPRGGGVRSPANLNPEQLAAAQHASSRDVVRAERDLDREVGTGERRRLMTAARQRAQNRRQRQPRESIRRGRT